MFFLRRVSGSSMEPTLKEGNIVLCRYSGKFKEGDVVVAIFNGREVIKRVAKYENGMVFLEGDNRQNSTDSRQKGPLVDTKVLGIVVWPFNVRRKY